jgi:hypothetical protein
MHEIQNFHLLEELVQVRYYWQLLSNLTNNDNAIYIY